MARTLSQMLADHSAYIEKCVQGDLRKKFRIGDRVRYRRMIGTIDMIVIDGGANMYDVRFDQGGRWSYRVTELHKVQA